MSCGVWVVIVGGVGFKGVESSGAHARRMLLHYQNDLFRKQADSVAGTTLFSKQVDAFLVHNLFSKQAVAFARAGSFPKQAATRKRRQLLFETKSSRKPANTVAGTEYAYLAGFIS